MGAGATPLSAEFWCLIYVEIVFGIMNESATVN